LIIGAGATARAAVAAVSSLSDSVEVINRNPDRNPLMIKAAHRDLSFLPWKQNSHINTADLVINTTPSNVADLFQSSIDSPQGVLFEVLYHPWPTSISKSWADSGAVVIDGLDLLIHQAISQVEIFGQVTINRSEMYGLMRQAALTHLG
jgi:shikimate dehydrogenase